MAQRLIHAAADQLSQVGLAAVSARSVARAGGVSASAINYNFDRIEHLFCLAFGQGSAETARRVAQWLDEIAQLPSGGAGAAAALEHVVDAWTREARPLALLYQEALAAPFAAAEALSWTVLWRDFWTEAAVRLGLDAGEGRLLHALFQSEALYHLSRWSPALERGALRELCAGLGSLFLGAPATSRLGALALAEARAGAARPGPATPAAVRIMRAAAQVVEAEGLAGLTHRAVAGRAGVSTGSVTHHFRTVEQLTAGAVRGEVLAMNEPDAPTPTPESAAALFVSLREYAAAAEAWGPSLRRRQLFLAAIRRPELASAAAVIRFAHGGTLAQGLEQVFAPPSGGAALCASLGSRLISASWFAAAADPQPQASRTAIVAALEAVLIREVGRGAEPDGRPGVQPA